MAKTVGKKSKKVRVAIIGVGNCASSLVQGVEYYKDAAEGTQIPGIMHTTLGGYHIGDVEFSAAIDIDAEKVGKDLSEAIFSGPEQHVQVCQRAQVECAGGARHDARWPGQVSVAGHQESARPHGRHREVVARTPRRTWSCRICRSAARKPPSGTWSRFCARAAPSSTAFRCSSPARSTGRVALKKPGCPSSATTSRARSARRSRIAC